jgi:hypothetical protein
MGEHRNPHPYRDLSHPDCPQSLVAVVVANLNKMKLRRIDKNKRQTDSKLRTLLRIDRRRYPIIIPTMHDHTLKPDMQMRGAPSFRFKDPIIVIVIVGTKTKRDEDAVRL